MTKSNNPSDPAVVQAQVAQLRQALGDVRAFRNETQQIIGPQKWAEEDSRNSACTAGEGASGVNFSILSLTLDPVDLEASVAKVKTFWESKGFTTRTETSPTEPGLIRLYAEDNGGRLMSFYANDKGSSLDMETICIAGDQTAIYKELYPEIYGLPSNPSPSPTAK